MRYFQEYVSNTLAGTGNQTYFQNGGAVRTGRVYYRIFQGGKLEYSLLFSNITDSTFGSASGCNKILEAWKILSLRVGVCPDCSMELTAEPEDFQDVFFDGKRQRQVNPGEFLACDPFELEAAAGQCLCVEIVVQGDILPCHEEIQIPVFVREGDVWVPSPRLPVPGMIGCRREVMRRIGFLGDSITQGIGATPGRYRHWNAEVARMLGDKNSYWNLGLGCGMAYDVASDGAWLFKAGQMDVIILCLGINDLIMGRSPEELKRDLMRIVSRLQSIGVKVVIQTMPPFFEEPDEWVDGWQEVNEYIRTTLTQQADGFFDVAPLLCESEKLPYKPRYGGHPNDAGCAVWAEGLGEYLAPLLERFFL